MIAELESAVAESGPSIRKINLGDLHPSPTNPRKHFDAEALAELAASIEEHGIKMPLLARPSKTEPGKYEIVAGERRYRANTLLVKGLAERGEVAVDEETSTRLATLLQQRTEAPVIVERLDDATVLELQLIENLQRKDLTALEEAQGYQRLIELKEKDYTPAKIAAKIGKSVDTVLNKLKMLKAPVSLQKALEEGRVGERHLVLVARVPGEKTRNEVVEKILRGAYDYDADENLPLGVRDTLRLITEDYCASLKGVPWKLEDAELVPDAGPCATCVHFARFAAEQDRDLAADLGNGRGQTDPLTCLNPACHKRKHDAVFKLKKQEAKGGAVTVLKPEEAAKIVSDQGSLRTTAVVKLDERPSYDHTGHWDNEKLPTWRELVEERLPAGAVKVANCKEAGVVELVDAKVAVDAARAHAKHGKAFAKTVTSGKKVMTEAEKKQKEKEAFENKVTARAKLCLLDHLRERAHEKGMDREAGLAVLDCVLREAGKDGCEMMATWLKIAPREKKKNEYGVTADAYREPMLAAIRAQDAGKPEIDALIMIATIARYVKAWGVDFRSLKPLQDHFGFDKKTITVLATAEVKAELEAKAAKKKPEKRSAGSNSVDPKHVSTDRINATTKAADKVAKGKSANAKDYADALAKKKEEDKGLETPLMKAATRGIVVGTPGPGMLGRGPTARTPAPNTKEGRAKVVKDMGEMLDQWQGLPASRLGKATGWTPADIESGASALKAKTHDITALIGSKPDRKKDAISYKNWNGLRMKLLRKAGLAK